MTEDSDSEEFKNLEDDQNKSYSFSKSSKSEDSDILDSESVRNMDSYLMPGQELQAPTTFEAPQEEEEASLKQERLKHKNVKKHSQNVEDEESFFVQPRDVVTSAKTDSRSWLAMTLGSQERLDRYSAYYKYVGYIDLMSLLEEATSTGLDEEGALRLLASGGLAELLEKYRYDENHATEHYIELWKKLHPIKRYFSYPVLTTERLLRSRDRVLAGMRGEVGEKVEFFQAAYDAINVILSSRGIANSLIDLQYCAEGKLLIEEYEVGLGSSFIKKLSQEHGQTSFTEYAKDLKIWVNRAVSDQSVPNFSSLCAMYYLLDNKLGAFEEGEAAGYNAFAKSQKTLSLVKAGKLKSFLKDQILVYRGVD